MNPEANSNKSRVLMVLLLCAVLALSWWVYENNKDKTRQSGVRVREAKATQVATSSSAIIDHVAGDAGLVVVSDPVYIESKYYSVETDIGASDVYTLVYKTLMQVVDLTKLYESTLRRYGYQITGVEVVKGKQIIIASNYKVTVTLTMANVDVKTRMVTILLTEEK
ncbi:hypothetical protein KW785_00830 [Candidatus Parcubacteria bacterium]|nr:hypothetical protein [Candidatus Parcubacteria bacterium]